MAETVDLEAEVRGKYSLQRLHGSKSHWSFKFDPSKFQEIRVPASAQLKNICGDAGGEHCIWGKILTVKNMKRGVADILFKEIHALFAEFQVPAQVTAGANADANLAMAKDLEAEKLEKKKIIVVRDLKQMKTICGNWITAVAGKAKVPKTINDENMKTILLFHNLIATLVCSKRIKAEGFPEPEEFEQLLKKRLDDASSSLIREQLKKIQCFQKNIKDLARMEETKAADEQVDKFIIDYFSGLSTEVASDAGAATKSTGTGTWTTHSTSSIVNEGEERVAATVHHNPDVESPRLISHPIESDADQGADRDLRVAGGSGLRNLPGSTIFKYQPLMVGEKLESMRLYVKLEGAKKKRDTPGENHLFHVRAVELTDTVFHQVKIFGDPRVMKLFGDGKIRTKEDVGKRIVNSVAERFGKGHPNGLLTVVCDDSEDVAEHKKIGFSIVGGGGKPGYSEIAGAFIPEYWNHKFGGACMDLLSHYASQTQEIGIGKSFQERDPAAAFVQSFRSYGGEYLKHIESTTSPKNYASIALLNNHGFGPADLNHARTAEQQIIKLDYEMTGDKYKNDQEIYRELKGKFENEFRTGDRFGVVLCDSDKIVRTVSWSKQFQEMKYHFEKPVVQLYTT
jgi:hypothetical protein